MHHTETEVARLLSLLLGQAVVPESNMSMASCPAWDSMKHIEIIMTLEEHFQVSFAPQDIPALTSQPLIVAKLQELAHA